MNESQQKNSHLQSETQSVKYENENLKISNQNWQKENEILKAGNGALKGNSEEAQRTLLSITEAYHHGMVVC